MLNYRKNEILAISFILIFALVATYQIYYKFKDSRGVDYNSDTIDVTFHEDKGDEVNILKVTPVTDAVGLTSKAHTFTVTNDTNKSLKYSIYVKDNTSLVKSDDCGEYQISKNLIKISIHKKGEENNIYTLSDLVNGKILTRTIKANQKEDYTMRFWVGRTNDIASGMKLHYHGLIHVDDEGTNVAVVN